MKYNKLETNDIDDVFVSWRYCSVVLILVDQRLALDSRIKFGTFPWLLLILEAEQNIRGLFIPMWRRLENGRG